MIPNPQRLRRRQAPGTWRGAPSKGVSPGSVIPYDYAASFELKGIPGNIVQDVINISVEGIFVAVAIGYGFEEERGRPIEIRLPGPPSVPFRPGDIALGQIPPEGLITGFRVNPRFEPMVFLTEEPGGRGTRVGVRREKRLSDQELPPDFRDKLFQRVKPPEEISFLFSIVDTGTGRELQDEPTHNLASLGKSNGERPFRLLPQPLSFLPRSTIRLQIIERSEGIRGTLFIVLYGYKILGGTGCPEPLVRSLRGSPICPTETIGSPSARVIPFDYVATFDLIGQPRNIVEAEIPINVDGGFVATTLGYGLAGEERDVAIQWERAAEIKDLALAGIVQPVASQARVWLDQFKKNPATAGTPPPVNLAQLPLRLFPTSALTDGIRVRPNFLRIVFENNGNLATALPVNLIDSAFEPLNRPEDVSFRYSILDSGTGRELQNQPINNIAGLGIANGDRPFKKFARPMIFFSRSTIRITVEERFGRGKLFLVFQGYKLLGGIPPRGRS